MLSCLLGYLVFKAFEKRNEELVITFFGEVNAGLTIGIVAVMREINVLGVITNLLRRKEVLVGRRHLDRDSAPFVNGLDDSERFLLTRVEETTHDEADVVAHLQWLQISV